ncbi:DUF4942 domain-containing protein [Paraburkholderia sp. EG285A]|uniref:DUF4942 domain-containing protein n=1 Tax=Paraburkholderia sp. EG285A TaxID=3237009 RepID=UPI0034D16F1C
MSDIVKSLSIENMLRQRDAVIDRLSAAKRLIDKADEIGARAGLGAVSGHIGDKYTHSRSGAPISAPDFIDSMTARIDAAGWGYLMKESGLRTLMDAKAREEWDKGVYEFRTPPLTLPNVTSTFEMLHAGRAELFDRGVIHCFKRLSWDYKTNLPFRFGKRLVLRHLYYAATGNYTQHVNHRGADELDDLVRVFSVLDGKPEPDHRNGMYVHLSEAARKCERTIELEYFSIRWFKNGNGHLTFARPELVEQLNRILARHYPNALASEMR